MAGFFLFQACLFIYMSAANLNLACTYIYYTYLMGQTLPVDINTDFILTLWPGDPKAWCLSETSCVLFSFLFSTCNSIVHCYLFGQTSFELLMQLLIRKLSGKLSWHCSLLAADCFDSHWRCCHVILASFASWVAIIVLALISFMIALHWYFNEYSVCGTVTKLTTQFNIWT